MRRLLTILSIATATILSVGCNDLEYDDSYNQTYLGQSLYSCATTANEQALDPVYVGFRFGILLSELQNEGLELKVGTTETFETKTVTDEDGNESQESQSWDNLSDLDNIDKRTYLFGSTSNVAIIRGENDIYTIEYSSNGFVGGSAESNYRSGKYIIDTKGLAFDETTSANPWKVTNDGYVMLGTSYEGTAPDAVCSEVSASIYHNGGGEFLFTLYSEMIADEYSDESDPAVWSTPSDPASVTFSGYDEDDGLLLEGVLNEQFEVDIFAAGVSVGGDTMSLTTTSPVIYDYTWSVWNPVSGEVNATVDGTDSYSAAEVDVSIDAFYDSSYGCVHCYTYYYGEYSYTDSFFYY